MKRLTVGAFRGAPPQPTDFGAVLDRPIPNDYAQLCAEIAQQQQDALVSPSIADRIAARARLAKLVDARDAWNRHVAATTPRPQAGDVAHAHAVTHGGC